MVRARCSNLTHNLPAMTCDLVAQPSTSLCISYNGSPLHTLTHSRQPPPKFFWTKLQHLENKPACDSAGQSPPHRSIFPHNKLPVYTLASYDEIRLHLSHSVFHSPLNSHLTHRLFTHPPAQQPPLEWYEWTAAPASAQQCVHYFAEWASSSWWCVVSSRILKWRGESLPVCIFLFPFLFFLLLSQSGGVCDCLRRSSFFCSLCFFLRVVRCVTACAYLPVPFYVSSASFSKWWGVWLPV